MGVYRSTPSNINDFQREILREFFGEDQSYVTEISGSPERGYRFQYVSVTTNYLSAYFRTKEEATEGLKVALLRSLVLNSPFSVLVIDLEGKVLFQSEKNISQLGVRRGELLCEQEKTKTSWVSQEVFDGSYLIYKEAG